MACEGPKTMTIEEAINHIESLVMKLKNSSFRPYTSDEANQACIEDHMNLMRWLIELRELRAGGSADVHHAITRLEQIDARQRFADSVLDKPEDRLWHAEDKTWWRREDGGYRLLRDDPPPEIEELARQAQEWRAAAKDAEVLARALRKFTREGVADDEAYDLAVAYQKLEEKA